MSKEIGPEEAEELAENLSQLLELIMTPEKKKAFFIIVAHHPTVRKIVNEGIDYDFQNN